MFTIKLIILKTIRLNPSDIQFQSDQPLAKEL